MRVQNCSTFFFCPKKASFLTTTATYSILFTKDYEKKKTSLEGTTACRLHRMSLIHMIKFMSPSCCQNPADKIYLICLSIKQKCRLYFYGLTFCVLCHCYFKGGFKRRKFFKIYFLINGQPSEKYIYRKPLLEGDFFCLASGHWQWEENIFNIFTSLRAPWIINTKPIKDLNLTRMSRKLLLIKIIGKS